MSLRVHAARILARVPADLDDEIRLTDGRIEVIVIVRPVSSPDDTDKAVHRRIIAVLTGEPKTAKAIARAAGYAASSLSTVRQGLADLVRQGRARHVPGGYLR